MRVKHNNNYKIAVPAGNKYYLLKRSIKTNAVMAVCVLMVFFLFPPKEVQAIEIIANSNVLQQSISTNQLLAIYLGRRRTWPGGEGIKVVMLKQRDSLHTKFCRDLLHITPRKIKHSWDRVVFSGTGRGATEVKTQQEMLQIIKDTPGAVGYIDRSAVLFEEEVGINVLTLE